MAVAPEVSVEMLLATRTLGLPATLIAEESTVRVEKLLRFMPSRRAIYAGQTAAGKRVVIKLFSQAPRSMKEFSREKRVLEDLRQRGIPAPDILAAQEGDQGTMLLLEHLGERSAGMVLNETDEPRHQVLLQSLVELTARMHKAGVLQRDIHLNNFIQHGDDWYVIDAGDIQVSEGQPSARDALENLALLLAQFPPLSLPSADRVARCYGGIFSAGDIARKLAGVRDKRLRKLVKKSLRDCTEFAELHVSGLTGMCRRGDLEKVKGLLERGLDNTLPGSESLKDGNSATVWRADIGAEPVVIKRYNLKNFAKKLARQFRSRARNSWMNASYLALVHVRTPRALCFVSEKNTGLTGREYLVCEHVNGRMLPEICEEGGPFREKALRQMADFFATMLLMRFSHGDSKYTNFLFVDGVLQVIDLDGMVRFPGGAALPQALEAQRRRLFESWKPREALAAGAEQEFESYYQARLKLIESWL